MRHTEELSGHWTHSPDEYAAGVPAPGEPAAAPAGESGQETWQPGYPGTARPTDTWVLVCGGIAAAAAFAAAFLAAGGVAGQHPATGAAVPAAVSQACPSAAP